MALFGRMHKLLTISLFVSGFFVILDYIIRSLFSYPMASFPFFVGEFILSFLLVTLNLFFFRVNILKLTFAFTFLGLLLSIFLNVGTPVLGFTPLNMLIYGGNVILLTAFWFVVAFLEYGFVYFIVDYMKG